MTKKPLKFTGNKIIEMTYEEVLDQFNDLLHKFANAAIDRIVFNKPEKEEVMQELRIQTWNAYNRYDLETKNNFSTYLHYYLQGGIQRSTTKLYARKRTNEAGTVSLNKLIGGADGEVEFEGLLGVDDFEMESLAFREFLNDLENKLSSSELTMLKVFLDIKDYSIQDLANDLGITRQGANKKIIKFREKMANILLENGYVVQ